MRVSKWIDQSITVITVDPHFLQSIFFRHKWSTSFNCYTREETVLHLQYRYVESYIDLTDANKNETFVHVDTINLVIWGKSELFIESKLIISSWGNHFGNYWSISFFMSDVH